MVSKTLEQGAEETKGDMTPMIDCTFLLLIFFMCSIKFKILEGKLQTYLPKDVGVNATPIQQILEKVDVRIDRVATREKLNLDDLDSYKAWKSAGWKLDQVSLHVMGQPVRSMDELKALLREMRKRIPAPDLKADPTAEDALKMNIEAMKGVLYEDVVRVVDEAIAAGFTSITFRGIEKDA
jgi:biopolymer transport protein ExbD